MRDSYRRAVTAFVMSPESPTGRITLAELQRGARGLLGVEVPLSRDVERDGAVVVGTPASAPAIAGLRMDCRSGAGRRRGVPHPIGHRGPSRRHRHRVDERRWSPPGNVPLPAPHPDRALDPAGEHRGAAADGSAAAEPLGQPRRDHRARLRRSRRSGTGANCRAAIDPRITDYAPRERVDRHQRHGAEQRQRESRVLTAPYLEKAAALALALRPYGIRVYLSANFAAPRMLGGPAHRRSARPRAWRAGGARRPTRSTG